ncbi:peptidoglycan editing factor PgeF [Ammoniphilus resinae]|uniref:Purine nucleoside phosphorylase n=1 Tax=Ammoniphilus resinae TaxID=861532 RepID=A0ABS4GKJ3_9BACL|nr:peptidoglycan editing factor PgeF [Ammoniphilus resinae]MBP1930672.1 YfiH family protein [Ammoniphilus resinae]
MEPFVKGEDASILHLISWENAVEGLTAGFTTRIGGQSEAHYEGLNCGLHVGDLDEKVIQNRKSICEKVGFPFEAWTCADQVHGNQVEIVTRHQRGSGNTSMVDCINKTDGLITAEKNILLTAFYADCVPLFFLAPEEQIIGIAHAGWKGTAANISQKMLHTLTSEYQIKIDSVKVAIGPSIGRCCYEVDERVVGPFLKIWSATELPDWITPNGINAGKYQLDLKEANRYLLMKSGIPSENILVSQWCTSCHTDLFYSHRKEDGKTGRMTAFIGWR